MRRIIRKIIDTLRCLEARGVSRVQKENKLFSFILNLFVFSLLFHLVFLFPLIFSKISTIQFIITVCIISLLPFSILLLRTILFITSENVLSTTSSKTTIGAQRELSTDEKELNSFKNMLASGIKENLAVCSVFTIIFLLYAVLIYGVLSLFFAFSLFFFFISFLSIVLFCGIVLLSIFLYLYLKDKDLIWPKIILPVTVCILTFFLLLAINPVFPLPSLFIYVCSFSCGWFSTYPLLRKLLGDKNLIVSFRFILFCFIVILILFLITILTVDQSYLYSLSGNTFLQPVLDTLAFIVAFINTCFVANRVFILFFPHLFVPVLLLSRTIYDVVFRFRQKLNPGLFKNQNNMELVFSGSLSFYHLLWVLFRSTLIIGILYLEVGPVSDFVYSLLKLFRISEIFHLDFLTRDTISLFFTLIFYIILAVIGLQCLDKTIMMIRSIFSLLSQAEQSVTGKSATDFPATDCSAEVVYVEKRLISKSVVRIPVKKIHYIMYHQNICERFFNTGTIRIETSDHSGVISIRGIPCIKEKYNLLMEKTKSAV